MKEECAEINTVEVEKLVVVANLCFLTFQNLRLAKTKPGVSFPHKRTRYLPKVGIRNLSPYLRNIADNHIDCGVAD
jgi:hypothetical protein